MELTPKYEKATLFFNFNYFISSDMYYFLFKKQRPKSGATTNYLRFLKQKYTTDIVPILQSNCYSCHGNGNNQGGIVLDNYTKIKALADSGIIRGVITHASGYIGMPYLKPKLDTCTISQILNWVGQGAPNN